MNAKDKIRAAKAISIMLNSFPLQHGTDAEVQLASFLECIDQFSPEAVEETCLRYRRGEIVGHDARFAPSTAQFTQSVKERQSHLDWLNASRIAPERQIPKPYSPRVSKEKMQAFTDALHGRRSWESLSEEFGIPVRDVD
ncbi:MULTISPECIES: hypothetical protein [Chelativorans]|jgi:hypothetical protein|uniref:Uncharacterized protein n=1 Tax=Chelativorans sp. (strain BNC1) TaxID=266779 RepID=Q11LV2_CHESB|nr:MULTISPECIES: hypothetical protein [Chelativorans]